MRYGLVILMLVGSLAYTDGWQKPKFVNPDKFDKHTFKDGTKGFKVEFAIKRTAFDGKVPEILDIFVCGDYQPDFIKGFVDEEKIPVFADRVSWHIIEYMDNDDITLVLYFDDPPEEVKDWKEIKLKVVGKYMSPEHRKKSLFGIETMKIKGIVGMGNNKDDKGYYIAIAECMPNIRGIVKKARVIAEKYGFTIEEIELRANYEYLLKENNE